MLKISGPVGAAAFVSVFLLSGAGASLSIESAHAGDCLAAPKTASPKGEHWYYHVDRASRRKCWYLHAAVQLRHRAVTRHRAAAAAADNAGPAPEPQIAAVPAAASAPPAASPTAPVPTPDSAAGDTPPAPHITVLAVRTSTPFVGTTAVPQQNTPEKTPAPPAPQTLPRGEGIPAVDGAKPAADAARAEPQGKADAQTAEAATTDAKTRTAEMFILLAFVFGIAAALVAIVSKIAGIYRTPRISADPDAAWLSYRSAARRRTDTEARYDEQDVPFLDPQEHCGLADLHAQEWLDRSTPAQHGSSASLPRKEDITQPPRPSQTDIEPALRVLRQARQSWVA
jgi:hypothetical protein